MQLLLIIIEIKLGGLGSWNNIRSIMLGFGREFRVRASMEYSNST